MTTQINGAVTPPAAPKAAAKRIELPSGPVTGRAAESVLGEAVKMFLPPDDPQPTVEPAAGKPAPTAPQPGAEGEEPDKENLPPEKTGADDGGEPETEPAAATELSAEDQAALAERAKANGVTPEQQLEAEQKELARLEAKAKAEGKTIEEVAADEEAEAAKANEKTFTQAQVEELVTKRVKNLAAENADLKKQLAETPVSAAAITGPLAEVNDPAKLAEAQSTAETGAQQAEDLLNELATDPEGVEEQLRKWMGKAADTADLSPAGMRKILRNARDGFKATLRAVPARQKYLADAAETHAVVLKATPWIADETDPRTVMMKQIERALPGLKQTATWEYWLSAAVEKHLERQQAAARPKAPAPKPGKFVPKVTFPKTASRATSPPPRVANAGDKIAQLKAAVKADPTNEKLQNELVEAMMSRPR